jgi:DNA-binding XRE family transcriptional regulator
VTKTAELCKRIKNLRKKLGDINQADLAKKLGVSPQTVSAWEARGMEMIPSSESFMKLGNLADWPDSLWFYECGGLTFDALSKMADKLLSERCRRPVEGELVYVPPFGEDVATEHRAGIWLPVQLIPNPALATCIKISEHSRIEGYYELKVLKPGDFIVFERNLSGPGLQKPFRDQMTVAVVGSRSMEWEELFLDFRRPVMVGRLELVPTDMSVVGWQWDFIPIDPEFERRSLTWQIFDDLYDGRSRERLSDPKFRKSVEKEMEARALVECTPKGIITLFRFLAWLRPPAKEK